jgi:hypothetical protein
MWKPAKKKDVRKLLVSKLKFHEGRPGKHQGLKFPSALAIQLPLQLPVELQHGGKDVAAHIVHQICSVLGLKHDKFVESHKCNVCAVSVYVSLLSSNALKFADNLRFDPPAYTQMFIEYCRSASRALDIVVREFPIRKLTKHDQEVVEVSRQSMDEAATIVGQIGVKDTIEDFRLLQQKLLDVSDPLIT